MKIIRQHLEKNLLMFRSDTQDRDQSDMDLNFIEHRKNSYNTSDPIPKSK